MVSVLELVTNFDDFAGRGREGDLVDRWRREVVEPHVEMFAAVESWVDPKVAPDRLPGLVARRVELRVAAERAKFVVQEAAKLLTEQIAAMEEQVEAHFGQHPDAETLLIYRGGPLL